MQKVELAQYAFDVIDRLRDARDEAATFEELTGVMDHFGFRSLIVTGVPLPNEKLDPLVMAARWPEGWTERYMASNYAARDPALKRVGEALDPFRWSDVRTPGLSREQRLVLDEAGEFGLSDGLAIPIHSASGYEAVVSFGGDRVDLGERDVAALRLIGIYGYEALRRRRASAGAGGLGLLSPREKECVRWTAAGKTAWEIGQILNISEATVNHYVKTASRKMNTATKAHLVARCIRAGLIN